MPRGSGRAAAAVALALVVGALVAGAGSDGRTGGGSAAPLSEHPSLRPRDCAAPAGLTVSCRWLDVPENREDPDRGGTVQIAVAILHSRSASPQPDPVVQIAGGPGGSGLAQLGFWATSPLLDQRDMVLFDQRGAGASLPSLDCPERDAALATNLGRAEPYAVEVEAYRAALTVCRERLVAVGVDLDQYDTEATAADLADLRVALGEEEWNLYGISYGTRIALATMRSHPEGIRSVVLDSAYPPGVGSLADVHGRADEAFGAFFDACAAEPACASAYPELEGVLEAVVERYNTTPITGTADLGPAAGIGTIVITGDDLRATFYNILSSTALNPQLPAILFRLASGDTTEIPALVARGVPRANALSEGVQLGAECGDNGGWFGPGRDLVEDPAGSAGFIVHLAGPYCELWDVDPLPTAFHDTVRSPIPTLVVVGTFDPVTPAGDSEATADTLEHAVYVALEGAGHGVSFDAPCVSTLAAAFVEAPDADALDTSCAEAFAPTFTA